MIKEALQPPKPRLGAQWCKLKISKLIAKVVVDYDEIGNVVDYDYIVFLVNSIDYDWIESRTSSHELQNFEQKILYRVVTHARYIKKGVIGADYPLIRLTNSIFFSLRKSTYDVFLTFPVAL